MSVETEKKFLAFISGGFASAFLDMALCLPEVRVHEGLDWRIEIGCYIVTLVPAIISGWMAFKED